MSDHKTNPQALMNATLPQLLPVGHRVGVNIQLQVMPRQNVMLVPADKMRTNADGVVEVLVGEEWRAAPEGADVCELGKPLSPEKCDVVAIIGTMVEDVLGPKLVDGSGQAPRGQVASGPLAALARAPLDKWQASMLGQLRGPVT